MRILLVVDYQNDFVDGSLGSPDAVSIEDAICARMVDYIASGDRIVLTADTHSEDYLDSLEGKLLPVQHCIEGTDGWNIHGKVGSMAAEHGLEIIRKHTFGCSELMDIMRDYDEIEICGVATNICVTANAVICRTANPQARISVRRGCVASYDRGLGEKALDVLRSLQIEILP